MAIRFLETENVHLNRVLSIRVAIFFCFILRALLFRHLVAFKQVYALLYAVKQAFYDVIASKRKCAWLLFSVILVFLVIQFVLNR